MMDIFDELNAEIAKALEKSNMRKKAVSAKKLAFDRTVGAKVRERAMAEWRELSALIEIELWKPISSAALFTEQQCDGCGSIHRVFLQYMEIQQHKSKPSSRRWLRVGLPTPGLPRETFVQPHKTHICPHCCDEHGFQFEGATMIGLSPSALNISETYIQGDINGSPEAH